MIFPAKIPDYVERDMLLPLDSYLEQQKDMRHPAVYRNLYMKFNGHDYGMVYDGDTHLLFYRKIFLRSIIMNIKPSMGKI